MIVALGSNHNGLKLKQHLMNSLRVAAVIDVGTTGTHASDYADFADQVALSLRLGKAALGILICESGVGMSIAANKHDHVRAALCFTPHAATLARAHNDANVLCLAAWYITEDTALDICRAFVKGRFEGGGHEGRLQKLRSSL
jgi:RpiB/LacA/LacB family sugar-phosphate isomerase